MSTLHTCGLVLVILVGMIALYMVVETFSEKIRESRMMQSVVVIVCISAMAFAMTVAVKIVLPSIPAHALTFQR